MQRIFNTIHISGGRTFLVGGSVRDSILGLKPKDNDYLVTGLHKVDLLDILSHFGHYKECGESFGVIKFVLHGTRDVIDIALPRTEVSTGVGHTDFEVDSGPHISVEQDLSRRDFSVNSIAVDVLTGERIDPFNGAEDLAEKRLRLVHDKSFQDDPLRMLRAVQFSARLDFQPDAEMLICLQRDAHLLSTVSYERISIELCKLMKAPKPSVGLRLMRDTGILRYVLPELADLVDLKQNPLYHAYDVFEHSIRACDAVPAKGRNLIWLRWVALCHDIGKFLRRQFKNLVGQYGEETRYAIEKNSIGDDQVVVYPVGIGGPWTSTGPWTMEQAGPVQFLGHDDAGADAAEIMFTRLKLTSVSEEAVPGVYIPQQKMVHMIRQHMFDCDVCSSPKSMRKFVAKVGRDTIFDQIRLRIADRSAKGLGEIDNSDWVIFAKKLRTLGHGQTTAFSLKELAIDGNDLMIALKMKPGPAVGKLLKSLFERVLENPDINNKEGLLALAELLTEESCNRNSSL